MFRAGGGDALGERELEEDLGDYLAKIGCSDELAKEQVGRLRRVRNFVAAAKGSQEGDGIEEGELEKGMVSGEEESWDVNEKEVVDWRDSEMEVAKEESFGTDTLGAQDDKTTGSIEAKRGFSHICPFLRI